MTAKRINAQLVRLIISTVLELAAIAAITWGCTLIAPFLGFIIGGIGLLVVALAIDPPNWRRKQKIEVPQ